MSDLMRAYVRCGRDAVEVGGSLLIGRSSHCEIVLKEDVASREHCRIEREGDRVFLVDLGSRNGVLVNGKRTGGRSELHHGDVVSIGATQLVLLRQHDPPSVERLSEDRTRPDAPVADPEDDLHAELVRAAERAIAQGDLAAAGANARGFVFAVRHVALTDALLASSCVLMLELAVRSTDPYWLDRVIELHLARRRPIPFELADHIVRASEVAGPPGPVLDDYLAAATRMTGFPEDAARRLSTLARP